MLVGAPWLPSCNLPDDVYKGKIDMADVRNVFPNLEKICRSKRGKPPAKSWSKPPPIDSIISAMCTSVLDYHLKEMKGPDGNIVELKRYILRSGSSFGYLCFKSSNVLFSNCRSYAELQKHFNALEHTIVWEKSLDKIVLYVANHCTSPAYIERIKKIKVNG